MPVVSLIFSKAFASVSHKNLTGKLRMYGLDECTVRMNTRIENWMKGRAQRVVTSGIESVCRPAQAVLPRGSALGPVLFNWIHQ